MLAEQESKGGWRKRETVRKQKKTKQNCTTFYNFLRLLKTLSVLLCSRRQSSRTAQKQPKGSHCLPAHTSVWGRRARAAPYLWLIAAHSWFDIRLANARADADAAARAAYQINGVPGWNWLGTRIQRKSRRLKFNQHQEPLQQESHLRIDLPIWGACRNTDEPVHLWACEKINNNIIRRGAEEGWRIRWFISCASKIPVCSKPTCISLVSVERPSCFCLPETIACDVCGVSAWCPSAEL